MEICSLSLLVNMSKALLLTIVIEITVLFLMKEKNKKIYLASIIINIFTNISLNLIIPIIPANYYDIIVLGLEIVIVIIEFFLYLLLFKNPKQAIKISFFCNFFSYVLGLIFMSFIY
ncbi:MAG: hypothetical protein WC479_12500 [Candidatus Izemoplasmatales bacterium]|jgi:hypothetical protein